MENTDPNEQTPAQKSIDALQNEAVNVSRTKGGGPGDGYMPLEELAATNPDGFSELHTALNSEDPVASGWAFEDVSGRWVHHTGYFAFRNQNGFLGSEGMGTD